jgi:hypothetical protein
MLLTRTTPSPRTSVRTPREQQAVEQLAVTTFSRGVAPVLALFFITLIVLVPVYETVQDVVTNLRTRERLVRQGVTGDTLPSRRPRIAKLLSYLPLPAPEALRALEDDLLLTSAARQALQPWTQSAITALGVGNRRVVFGRNGWLHYIDGVEYVTGPGFLTPQHLEAARANGLEGDPRPAILQLHRELQAMGVDLIVLPVPDKATIVPGTLARDLEGTFGLQNRSWETFVAELRRSGVHLLDATRPMADAEARGETQFMRADTHWTPAGVDVTARAVAGMLAGELGMTPGVELRYRRSDNRVERETADLPELLNLPPSQLRRLGHESIVLHQVIDASGRLWEATPGSEILLLGDSFTEAWSSSSSSQASGLAEQISYYMQKPLERRASHRYNLFDVRATLGTSRAEVQRAASGRRVVIWEFAARKLSFGEWPLLP